MSNAQLLVLVLLPLTFVHCGGRVLDGPVGGAGSEERLDGGKDPVEAGSTPAPAPVPVTSAGR